jgi:hypothetical protein
LHDLNEDCLVHIFLLLTNQDLNTVPIVNKTCREARDNDSLIRRAPPPLFVRRENHHARVALGHVQYRRQHFDTKKYKDEDYRLGNPGEWSIPARTF